MSKYRVTVERKYTHVGTIDIEADTIEEAEEAAGMQVGDIEFHVSHSDDNDFIHASLVFEPSPLSGMKLNTNNSDRIIGMIKLNSGYCPCVPVRTPDTKCPCKTYRLERRCCCNLYVNEREQ
jgi:hypothetical protein